MDKVSIVIPVYNSEKYLDRCIFSLIKQSYSNIEIIFVNDGSSDNSMKVIKSWAKQDSRIIYENQKNQGVTCARKNGVNLASGDWILFIDSDDELPLNAVETMIKYKDDYDIIIGQLSIEGTTPWPYPRISAELTQKDWIHSLMVKKNIHWGPVAKLFKKNLFNDFVLNIPRKITNGEDFIFNLRIGLRASKIKVIENTVYNYIIREGSAMSSDPFASLSYCFLFEKEIWKSFRNKRLKYSADYLQHIVKTIYKRTKHILNLNLAKKATKHVQ